MTTAADDGTTPPDLPVEIGPVSLIEVSLDSASDLERLLGLDLDIIETGPGGVARLLGWPGSAEALTRAGFTWRPVEVDYGAAMARAAGLPPGAPRSTSRKPGPADGPGGPAASPPLGLGSLGGYHTLAEIDAFLVDLAANDPNGIVGAPVQIGTSRQGRAIRAIRIAKESLPDHSRPRVLFTALHHAREPIGMQAVLEFMRRLVADYGVDPNITYLVDRREMWFVPVVNPDGYMINQTTWFNTGSFGSWRKNARDNDSNGAINSNDGVDINRNYAYRWAYDNGGSSPLTSSLVYRGTSAFSEPETKAVRDFCLAHQFVTANNLHTYGELCIYPWGYNGTNAPDSTFFKRMAEEMMRDLSYACGVGASVLYATNGDANDWMYGEQGTKPKCFAVTTEVGDRNDGFWPPAARIPELAGAQFHANMTLAYAAGPSVWSDGNQIVTWDGYLHSGGSGQLAITLRNAGAAATTGTVQVSAATTVPGITVTDPLSTFPALDPGATATPSNGDLIALSAAIAVPPGTLVPIILTITDQGSYSARDTTTIVVGAPQVMFEDDGGQGLANWIVSSRWGVQTIAGDARFTDSPTGVYTTQADATMTLAAPINLSGAGHAWLQFRTSYDIEVGADCGRVEVSTDGGVGWTAVVGRLTRPGHGMTGLYANGTQPLGVPLYDATQLLEETECMDLTAWCGHSDVRLRFHFSSDENGRREGWYVDDIRLLAYPDLSTGVPEAGPDGPPPRVTAAYPNPFHGTTRLTAHFPAPTRFRARVFGADGRLVRTLAEGLAAEGPHDFSWDGRRVDGAAATAGAYFIRLEWAGGAESRRVLLIR